MKKMGRRQGSEYWAQPVLLGKDTVYEHTNIELINKEEGLYAYDEVQYTKDEYIEELGRRQSQKDEDITNLELAIAELYESTVSEV